MRPSRSDPPRPCSNSATLDITAASAACRKNAAPARSPRAATRDDGRPRRSALLKSRQPLYGGRNACDINREHVHNVFLVRVEKYRKAMGEV